jgi:hypothetical protein
MRCGGGCMVRAGKEEIIVYGHEADEGYFQHRLSGSSVFSEI